MYAVIFKAQFNNIDQSYFDIAAHLRELAINKYGCIDFVSVSENSEEICISYWKDEKQIANWKNDPEHIKAQELGRSKWYKSFTVQIVKVEREYGLNVD